MHLQGDYLRHQSPDVKASSSSTMSFHLKLHCSLLSWEFANLCKSSLKNINKNTESIGICLLFCLFFSPLFVRAFPSKVLAKLSNFVGGYLDQSLSQSPLLCPLGLYALSSLILTFACFLTLFHQHFES